MLDSPAQFEEVNDKTNEQGKYFWRTRQKTTMFPHVNKGIMYM